MRIPLLLPFALLVACDAPPPVRHADPRAVQHVEYPTDCDTRTTPGPFERACAAKALASVDLSGCLQDGSAGGGHLKVRFVPSGNVDETQVDSPNFTDTATGRCVEERFRRIHIPPFQGSPVTVGKSFTVQ